MEGIKTLRNIGDVRGKNIIIRLDLNVPVLDGKVTNTYRIKKSLQTINFLKDKGARLILISHIKNKEENSLEPVHKELQKFFDIKFVKDIYENDAKATVDSMQDGEIVLFENLRMWEGEKANDSKFAEHLASFASIYVNDAFAVCHREHASVVTLPTLLPSYAGFTVLEEVENLSRLQNPEHPFIFIIGGAKFETKLPLIQKFLDIADKIYISGALANDFFEAMGLQIGKSLVSKVDIDINFLNNMKIELPKDVLTQCGDKICNALPEEVDEDDKIVDIGEGSLEYLDDELKKYKTILWNGPLGYYEFGFDHGTRQLAKMVAQSDAKSYVGGGDTIAAIEDLGLEDDITFMSTGGGAMLDFLANDTLPGLEALK